MEEYDDDAGVSCCTVYTHEGERSFSLFSSSFFVFFFSFFWFSHLLRRLSLAVNSERSAPIRKVEKKEEEQIEKEERKTERKKRETRSLEKETKRKSIPC